eukprot:SAG25_NODE_1034_length_4219_cov_3.886408_2_plen_120_part_00
MIHSPRRKRGHRAPAPRQPAGGSAQAPCVRHHGAAGLGEGCGRSEYDGRGDAMMYIRRNSQVDGSSGTIMGRGKLPRMSCWLSEIMHKCNDRLLAETGAMRTGWSETTRSQEGACALQL